MRTNIEIDDKLIKQAKKISRVKTKKEIVDIALKVYIKTQQRKQLLEKFGKIEWEGNLKQMREI